MHFAEPGLTFRVANGSTVLVSLRRNKLKNGINPTKSQPKPLESITVPRLAPKSPRNRRKSGQNPLFVHLPKFFHHKEAHYVIVKKVQKRPKFTIDHPGTSVSPVNNVPEWKILEKPPIVPIFQGSKEGRVLLENSTWRGTFRGREKVPKRPENREFAPDSVWGPLFLAI